MKKWMGLLLCLLMVFLCACGSGIGEVSLQDTVELGADGLVEAAVLEQIKAENAIAVFAGQSNGYSYEWTVFGSDLGAVSDVSFLTQITPEEDGVSLSFDQKESFGFPALLSVTLDEQWTAQTATAWEGTAPVASVSLTGTKQTVLNLSVNRVPSSLIIRPDPLPADGAPVTEEQPVTETAPQESAPQSTAPQTPVVDAYLSDAQTTDGQTVSGTADQSGDRVYSDGTQTGQDQYLTDPVPAGKPVPVEPEDQNVDTEKTYTCTFSIECSTILNNLDDLDPDKLEMVPSGGTILSTTTVTFYEGESVFDVLQRLCRDQGIHMESSWTPIYNSAYVEGIHNLYEFDCGSLSGWMYRVNGWYPNYGCSRYVLQQGDVVEWRYTCDLGHDVGGAYAVGGQSAG